MCADDGSGAPGSGVTYCGDSCTPCAAPQVCVQGECRCPDEGGGGQEETAFRASAQLGTSEQCGELLVACALHGWLVRGWPGGRVAGAAEGCGPRRRRVLPCTAQLSMTWHSAAPGPEGGSSLRPQHTTSRPAYPCAPLPHLCRRLLQRVLRQQGVPAGGRQLHVHLPLR